MICVIKLHYKIIARIRIWKDFLYLVKDVKKIWKDTRIYTLNK